MPSHTPAYHAPVNSQATSNASKSFLAPKSTKPIVATSPPSLSTPETLGAVGGDVPNRLWVVPAIPNTAAGPYLPTHGPPPCNGEDGDLTFDFDWSNPPGADQWSMNQTSDMRAVYSTKDGVTPCVVVEFLKCDW